MIIPEVVRSFLSGDKKTLEKWCDALCCCPGDMHAVEGVWVCVCVNVARRCKESAMNQINAVFRAREVEGLTCDPTILSVSNVDVAAAKVLRQGYPVLVVSAMVQQINCITNAKVRAAVVLSPSRASVHACECGGCVCAAQEEVVEGNENEIRAVFYVFAVVREYEPETAELHWKIAEMSMIGSQLYL